MKKICYFTALVLLFVSCSKKEEDPVVADFDAVVSGQSPNAKIKLTNISTGATSFKWNFDIGTTDSVSTQESPADLEIDKAGDFTIKLTAVNGSEKQTASKTISIPGHNALITYNNLEFALEPGNTSYGRYFSFKSGKMYKDSEINNSNGPDIHLGFGSMSHTMYFFVSPDDHSTGLLTIAGATHTKIINWQSTPSITVSAFDAMQDDQLLSGLTISETNDSFDNSLPTTILFQLASGRKGVIKAKAVNSDRLLTDIKIQKY